MEITLKYTEADIARILKADAERRGFKVTSPTVSFSYDRPPNPTATDPGTGVTAKVYCTTEPDSG